MYRWFLRHFPRGGSYADIHHALIEEGYTDWAESLVEYAWKKWLADENFAHQEVSSMQKLATDPGERPFCSQFARSDDHARIGCCEDNARIATAGYAAQIASMGYSVRIGSVGFNSHIGSSGERARVAVTGNSSRISSAGDSSRIANTGMRVRVCTLGERCHVASNGDLVQIASFGANARIANSGDNVHIIASGENSTVVSTGVVDSIILGPGGSAALAIMTAKEFASPSPLKVKTIFEPESAIVLMNSISLLSADSFTFNQTKDADEHGMQALRPPEPSPHQFLHMP